jgi:3-dehydroquinate synthase class II
LVSNVEIVNKESKTVSRSEIISTGNSVTNYKYADEGAARHFDEQIKEKGIWKALGLIK